MPPEEFTNDARLAELQEAFPHLGWHREETRYIGRGGEFVDDDAFEIGVRIRYDLRIGNLCGWQGEWSVDSAIDCAGDNEGTIDEVRDWMERRVEELQEMANHYSSAAKALKGASG